jgi:hypothetical protein
MLEYKWIWLSLRTPIKEETATGSRKIDRNETTDEI